jgi:hypothetical protein
MPYAQQIAGLQRELAHLKTRRRFTPPRFRRALDNDIARLEARILALRRAAAAAVRQPVPQRAAPFVPRFSPPRPILSPWPSPSAPAVATMDPSVADQEAQAQAALTALDQAQVQAVEEAAATEPSAVRTYGPWVLLALVGGYAYSRRKGKGKRADVGAS